MVGPVSRRRNRTAHLNSQYRTLNEFLDQLGTDGADNANSSAVNTIFDQLDDELQVVATNYRNAALSADNFDASIQASRENVQAMQTQLAGMSLSARAASIATRGLSIALNAVAGIVIGLAIQTAIRLIDSWIHASEKAQQAAQDLQNQHSQTTSAITDNLNTLNGLSSRYDELSKGVGKYGENVALTAEEYAEYKDIVSQVLGISPSLITGYDAEGNAISSKNDLIRESIALLKEQQQVEANTQIYGANEEGKNNFQTLFKGAKAEYDEAAQQYERASKELGAAIYNQIQQATPEKQAAYIDSIWQSLGYGDDHSMELPDLSAYSGEVLEKILGDLNASGLIERETEELRSARIAYETELKNLAQVNKNFSSTLSIVPQTVEGYDDLSDLYKSIISSLANSFNIEDMDFDGAKAARDLISRVTEGFVNGAPELIDIADLIQFQDTISAEEFIAKIKDAINRAAAVLGADPEDLMVWFNIDPQINPEQMLNALYEKVGGAGSELGQYLGTLSIDDLQIAYKIENIGTMTLPQLQREIEYLKKSAAAPIEIKTDAKSTIDSFSDIEANAEKLNKVFEDLADEDFDGISFDALNEINSSAVLTALDGYQKFINVLSSSQSTIADIKAATSDLFNEYIDSTGILNNVTAANKDLVAAMLKSIGVTNAEEVATSAMNSQLIERKLAAIEAETATNGLVNATNAELNAFIAEAEQAGFTSDAINAYALEKIFANENVLTTDGDISNLLALAEACGVAAGALQSFQYAKTNLDRVTTEAEKYTPGTTGYQIAQNQIEVWTDNAEFWREQILSSVRDFKSHNINAGGTAKANYGGTAKNSGGKKSGGGGSKTATEKELIELNELYETEVKMAEIEKKLENLRRERDMLEYKDGSRLRSKYLTSEINVIRDYQEAILNGGELDSEWSNQEQLMASVNRIAEKYGQTLEDLVATMEEPSDAFSTRIAEEISLIQQEVSAIQEQNNVLHEQNEIRRRLIRSNLEKLTRFGFKYEYDAENNYLDITNYEDAQKLLDSYSKSLGYNTEQQNKATEAAKEILDTVIELNQANQEGSKTWLDNAKAVEELRQAIRDLNKELFDEFTSRYEDYIDHMLDFGKWTSNDQLAEYKKYLQDIEEWYDRELISYEDYIKKHNEITKEMYDTQKSALEEILDMVEEIVKQEIEDQIDALEEQRDRYQEIVDLKRESLRLSEEQRQYDEDVDDKAREIAKLQERIDQLSLDDSREAQAQKAELLEQLYQLQKELADAQRDHSVDLTEDALDKEQDAYEDAIDKEIDALEDQANNAAYIHEKVVEYITENWDGLYSKLVEWNSIYGTGVEADVLEPWNNAINALEEYKNKLGEISIEQAALAGLNPISPSKPDSDDTISDATEYQQQSVIEKMKANSRAWDATTDAAKRKKLEEANVELARELDELLGPEVSLRKGNDGYWYYVGGKHHNEKVYSIYHKGGEVGVAGKSSRNNEVFSLLESGENVLTKSDSKIAAALMRSGLTALSEAPNSLLEGIMKNTSSIASLLRQQAQPILSTASRREFASFAPVLNLKVYTKSDNAEEIAKTTSNAVIDRMMSVFSKNGVGTKYHSLK